MAERCQYEDSDISDAPSSSSTKATAAFIQGTSGDVHFTMKDHAKLEVVLDQGTSRRKDVNYRRLIGVINHHTEQETAGGITEDFKNEMLCEPDFEVFPQMKKVKVADYYKGRFREENLSAAQTSREIIRSSQSELIKEIGFHSQQGDDGKWITIEELMESISRTEELRPRDEVGYTAVVASAGSGKTTLMRRIARKALEISTVNKKGERAPSQLKRKMIYYIELKNLEDENSIKTSKFLFDGLFKNESEEEKAFEWLVENQSEAIIIFDGLDQMKWVFEESGVRNIKPYQKASSAIIMYNILSRKILRHVKIIVSSREFKVSELPADARPKDIITLNGLTLQDAYKLFTFLLCKNGQHLWKRIEIMSPRLLQLVSVPVFLILIAVVMGIDPDRPPPSTVTELYSRIMLVLQSVENIRNHKEILLIINKLKAMAFEGMEEGRVVFYKTDLDHFKLSADEVQDLMTKVPGTNILSRRLMEGNFTFFFCHQSMQEFLAAIFISEMKLKIFCQFDGQHLHEKRWSVVRRFVTGIVYMKSNNDLHNVSDQTQKQEVLFQSIRSQLHVTTKSKDNYVRMELYTAIYESGNDNLMKDLSVIDASFISLNRDEAHIVASLASRNQSLRSLNLQYCRIDDEIFSIMARCLENPIRVKEVDLRSNNFSATALRSLLGHRRIESLSGKLDWEVVKLTRGELEVELKNEEDVIKISGHWIKGHFDFKDSALSLKKVMSMGALKYIIDLLDVTFVKIIEKLVVRVDGLRELSEYRVEKVKVVDWRSVPATALHSFFGHRRIESLSAKLDWEVVKLTVDGWVVELKNEEDVIKISGGNITGHFNIKDSTLSFKIVHSLAAVEFFIKLFDTEFVKMIKELYVEPADLRELLECKVEKISKIVLDRTKENIDWSMIETCWKKYQLDVLDIAVNGEIPVDDYKLILERGRAISVPLHIHAMFYVGKADEFRKTLEACQRKKIEYVRCILWDPVTLDQILSLINNSNLKNVTLIYKWDHEMLTGDKLRKAQKIASDLDTELEVLKLDPEGDALQRIDLRFLLEEVGEDKALHATALIAYGSLQSSSSKLKLEV